MPSLSAASDAFRAAGIDQDRPVVFYDAASSLGAARAWWVLSYFGHSNIRVLDGGLAAWTKAGYAVETGPVEVARGNVALSPGTELYAKPTTSSPVLRLAVSLMLALRRAFAERLSQLTTPQVTSRVPSACPR
ncbi:rhodanese-like domain-containing protein [Ornithinimicrobium sp. INDO-MA30-4]|uniref:sulfurtransferase n=1 Tax=Ornithinimicrobium sp. INDO-MA30-4 TaxID=2908651 RepID=UPI0028830779|nr:rhodanese-like domain-containing protein [Ornithinimicrobium sp. INDO-MA30-4]